MTKESDNSVKSKRIAKNTLMLYFRMLLMMGATLYTSRVVLGALGVEDYGIYNVVGGVVAMFTMISGSLSSAISRFITFELGKGNQKKLNAIFSTSVIIQILIAIIIAILIETVGVWFLTHKMVIPPDRLEAAKWVLHLSLISLIINLISIPYNAAIIAHEHMSAFAYISILEALGRLAIAYFIVISPIDKLIFYAILMALVALIVRMVYGIYCSKHFEECRFRWILNKELLREMFGFAGWEFFGTASALVRDQGGNIILNIVGGGPAVNAARGISTQVNTAITQFSSNFMMALNPQITKSYASGDFSYMMTLIFKGSRYAFYMLLTLSLPIIFYAPYVLGLWLGEYPAYTVSFVRLALIFGMCDAIARPSINAILATGKIKKVQIIVGVVQVMNLPISYVLLRLGFSPNYVYVVAIALVLVCLVVRLVMLNKMIGLSVANFAKEVLLNLFIVTVISLIVPVLVCNYMPVETFFRFVVVSLICVLSTVLVLYIVGCDKNEKIFIRQKVGQLINKYKKK